MQPQFRSKIFRIDSQLIAHSLQQALADLFLAVLERREPITEIDPTVTAFAVCFESHGNALPLSESIQALDELVTVHFNDRTFMCEFQP